MKYKELEQNKNDIIKLYTEDMLGHSVIANMYGTYKNAIKKILINNNIEIDTKVRRSQKYDSFIAFEIIRLYTEEKNTINDIKNLLKVSRKKITKILTSNDIEIRTQYNEIYVNNRDLNSKHMCAVEFCSENAKFKLNDIYYCGRHYNQIKNNGGILEFTKVDKNKFRIEDGVCYVEHYDKNYNVLGEFIIDIEDIWVLDKYRFGVSNHGYPMTNGIYLSDILMNNTDKKHIVDHINRDKLDNRKSNLRLCDRLQNNRNKNKHKNNTSGVVGVRKTKNNKWSAFIGIDYKSHSLGTYDEFDDAVKSRILKEAVIFKEFSGNYNPTTGTICLLYYDNFNLQTFIEVSLSGEILQFTKLP